MKFEKKHFGTDGIRGKVGQFPINAEFFLKLGWAVGRVFSEQSEKVQIILGKDTRISGYMFESALEAGLSAAGADCRLLGPIPTPAVAYLTRTLRANAGIVISASHNLYDDNGIKFFSAQGFKLPDELELAIEAELEKPMLTVDSGHLGKAKRIVDAPGRYIEFCKSTIATDVSLNGLRIVVDCANGAAYQVAPAVLTELGAQVICINNHPNGFNINKNCGSTHLEKIKEKVLEKDADLGIAFDGDADRCIMVDHKGMAADGDDLLHIMLQERLRSNSIGGGIVGTLMTNLALEKEILSKGLKFIRAQVGDRYVLAELLKQGWILGGEASGHIINLDLTTSGDGLISALQVLKAICKSGLSLHEMKHSLEKYPQILVNVRLHNECMPLDTQNVKEAVSKAQKHLGDRGRILVRASGTEPLIRVMAEGEDEVEVNTIANELAKVIEQAS